MLTRMNERDIEAAASILWEKWQRTGRIPQLPAPCRPADRAEGYRIQEKLAEISGQHVSGWKIAATSAAGQAHIAVDGPLAGRLLDKRVLPDNSTIPLHGNLMRVAEAEFAFRLGDDLRRRGRDYSVEEVMDAVEGLHVAIEVPDSRFEDYTAVGAPQLIADNACACWFILGAPADPGWRKLDLAQHKVDGYRNGDRVTTGIGANVLGDPRLALTWIANELNRFGDELRAGQVVTTGTCIAPIAVLPGDHARMDFGALGSVDAQF